MECPRTTGNADLCGRRGLVVEGRLAIRQAEPDPGSVKVGPDRGEIHPDLGPIRRLTSGGPDAAEPDDIDPGPIAQSGETTSSRGSWCGIDDDPEACQAAGRWDRRIKGEHGSKR